LKARSFTHPRPGCGLDWLSVDRNGYVGLFSTGGQGPVPQAVADRLAEVEAAVRRVHYLPVNSDCDRRPSSPGDHGFWIETARRGLFGFDWARCARRRSRG